MAENDGRYGFGVTLTDESVHRVAEEVKKEFQGMSQTAEREGSKIENSFKKIGAVLGVGFGLKAASDFGKQIIKVRGEIESLEVSFRTLLGSEQKAVALMTDIRKFAASTPMQLNDLAAGAQTLLGFNIEAEKVMPTLKALGDISMGDSQKFQSLTLAFAQMSSTGKLMGQDLLQMINAGFNPLVQIAERTGKSVGELKEEMSKGKISVEMVTQAFMDATGEGGKFYNMLEKQSQGIQGSLSNLQGAFDDMLNDLGEKSDNVITKGVQGLTTLVRNYETVGKVIGTCVVAYGSYKAAVMAYNVVATISNGLTAGLTAKEIIHAYTLGVVTKAQKLLNATMLKNPYVLAATALISLVSALVIFSKRVSDAEAAQRSFDAVVARQKEKDETRTNSINEVIAKIKDETQTVYARTEAYKEFAKQFPELFKQYAETGEMTDEIKAKIDALIADPKKLNIEIESQGTADLEASLKKYQDAKDEYVRTIGTNTVAFRALLKSFEEEAEAIGMSVSTGANFSQFIEHQIEATKKALHERQKEIRKAQWDALPIEQKIDVKTEQLEAAERELKRLQGNVNDPKKNHFAFNPELDAALNRVALLKGEIKTLQNEAASQPVVNFQSLQKDTRGAYNDMLAAQRAYRNSPTNANEEAYDKSKETFEGYDKQYEKATGKKYSDILKDSKDRQKQQRELDAAERKAREEHDKWLIEQARQAEFDRRQAEIDAMKEGLPKTIKQIELDYDQQIAAVSVREEEMVEKLRDLKEAEWNAANPTKKKNGEKFDRSTVTAADLTKEQQDQLTAYTEQALAERNRLEREAMDEMTGAKKTYLAQQAEMERQYLEARKLLVEKGATDDDIALFDRTYQANQKALFNEMLGDYVSYQQQMTDYTEEYENKRAELEELMAKTNDPTKKKNIKQAIDMLEKEYKRGFSNLQRTFIEDNIGDVFVEATYENVKEAIQKLTEMEGYKDAAEFNAKYGTNITDAEFSSFIANVKKVKREIQDLGKGGYTLRDAFKDAFTGKTKEEVQRGVDYIVSGFSKVASVASGIASAMREFAEATGNAKLEKMADTFDSIANTISTAGGYAAAGASIGGGWGAIIGAVLGIGQGVITGILKSNEQRAAEEKQRTEEAHDYLQDVIDGIGSVIGSIDSLSDVVSSLNYLGYQKELIAAISSLRSDENYNSEDNWSGLYDGVDFNRAANSLDDQHLLQVLKETIVGNSNGGAQTLSSLIISDWPGLLDQLINGTINESGRQYILGIIRKYQSQSDSNVREQYANQENHKDYILDQRRLHLIEEMNALLREGNLSSIEYFNILMKADKLSIDMLKQKREELYRTGQSTIDIDNQIAEAEYNMQERVRNMFEGLAGIDLQGIVDKWLDIFNKFGDNFDGAIEKINESIDDMIRNMVIQTVFVQPLLARLKAYMNDYAEKNLEKDEDGNYIWTNDAFQGMAEGLRGFISGAKEDYIGLSNVLNRLGIGFGDSANDRSAQAKGIATASQDSVDELNGRATTIQGHTFNISENSNIIRDNTNAILGSVRQIEYYTQHLVRMDNDIHTLKNTIDDIQSQGVRIRT